MIDDEFNFEGLIKPIDSKDVESDLQVVSTEFGGSTSVSEKTTKNVIDTETNKIQNPNSIHIKKYIIYLRKTDHVEKKEPQSS